jgi:HlyD family secretion protein
VRHFAPPRQDGIYAVRDFAFNGKIIGNNGALIVKQAIFIVIFSLFIVACQPITPEGQAQIAPTETPRPTAEAAQRTTYTVERGDVREEYTFTGRWLPRDQSQLSFQVAGNVRSVNVQRGDTVRAGDILADLQIDDLESTLATQQLDLEAAQRNLENSGSTSGDSVVDAQFNLANANLSLDSQIASAPWTGVENARVNVEQAERALENRQREYDDLVSRPESSASAVDGAYEALLQAQESLDSAQRALYDAQVTYYNYTIQVDQQRNTVLQNEMALEDAQTGDGDPDLVDAVVRAQLAIDETRAKIAQSTLIAPFDGVVLEITIRSGDSVEAYTAVITLALPEPREAIAELAYNDILLLQVGQIGTCEESNKPETAVQCVIRQLPLTNRDVDQSVRVAATMPDSQQGALIDITMILDESLDTLWLPPEAIYEFGDRTYVVLQTPEGERVQDVTIGLETTERIEILSGVEEGDVVVQQ